MTSRGYIVTGSGRTGSHWFEQVIKYVTDLETIDIDRVTDDQPFVVHDHQIKKLLSVPDAVRRSCLLILTKRSDLFSQAISLAVARHTDEWFCYTDRPISPFEIDPDFFDTLINGLKAWDAQFHDLVRPLYQSVIEVHFEDMLANSDRIEDWVADQIGMPNTAGHKSWVRNRNPRNYSHLIENYQQLIDRFGKCPLT